MFIDTGDTSTKALGANAEPLEEEDRFGRTATPPPAPPDGSKWMHEALEQHRGLADIYSSLTMLKEGSMRAMIVAPPEDLR